MPYFKATICEYREHTCHEYSFVIQGEAEEVEAIVKTAYPKAWSVKIERVVMRP